MPSAPEPVHAKLSPSSAYRWIPCTASIGFIEQNSAILPKESSVYADEGTAAHNWAAKLLTKEIRLLDCGADMMQHVRAYVDFVQEKVMPGSRLLVEKRVQLFYNKKQYGTTDAAIIAPGSIYIADLKYGAGVSVYAKDNPQLAIYAESLIRELEVIEDVADDTVVTLAIFQPRDRNDANPVRLWVLSRGELRQFCKRVEEAQAKIDAGQVEFVPNPAKQCRFCPAVGICKAYAAHGMTALSEAPIDQTLDAPKIELPNPNLITREQRQKVLKAKKALEDWLEAVEEQEKNELMAGKPALEFKLVEGKANRVWTDEKAVEERLLKFAKQEDIRPPSDLISPAAAQKVAKAAGVDFELHFEQFITKPAGKPTLVPVSDKRPAIECNPTSGFVAYDVI